jgi:hypothetical protein
MSPRTQGTGPRRFLSEEPAAAHRRDTITLTLINEDKNRPEVQPDAGHHTSKCPVCGREISHCIGIEGLSVLCECGEEVVVNLPAQPKRFTGFLSVMARREGKHIRPFLPFFTFEVSSGYYEELLSEINYLNDKIRISYPGHPEEVTHYIREIGEKILGMGDSLKMVVDRVLRSSDDFQSLVIFTNDASIPWQWSYSTTEGKFIITEYSCGTIFVDNPRQYAPRPPDPKSGVGTRRTGVREVRQEELLSALASKKAFVISAGPDASLPSIGREHESISRELISSGFEQENIVFLSDLLAAERGASEKSHSPAALVRRELAVMEPDDLAIVHFCGHLGACDPSARLESGDSSKCVPWLQITDNPADRILAEDLDRALKGEPLVFLNGCTSGAVGDMWNKSASISLDFLNRGASGCIVTAAIIEDTASSEIAEIFYNHLLRAPYRVTYGHALWKTRQDIIHRYGLWNPMPLMFHL